MSHSDAVNATGKESGKHRFWLGGIEPNLRHWIQLRENNNKEAAEILVGIAVTATCT